MITDKLYDLAEKDGIEVICGADLPRVKSISVETDINCVIAIDDSAMETIAEERVHLAHELGHCETGSFYHAYSPLEARSRQEARAWRWAIKKLIPKDEFVKCLSEQDGVWHAADYFGVTEDFIRRAYEYYDSIGVISHA